jgi:endonuclease/exonuclease/phosphatase family metal-dependent hydrolase
MRLPALFCSTWLLLSFNTIADSYVFITNSTAEPVQINIRHASSGTTLTPGSQWRQEATEIAPYATKRVLAFNRNQGVKRNQSYTFETAIIANDGSVATAQQRMVGQWVGSKIEHSVQTASQQTPWLQHRDIARYQSVYQQKPTTVALKAEFTGGYDDFYYTISRNTQAEPLSANGQLKVLSYNIYALPLVASDISSRIQELPAYLRGYDVILLQEAFSADSPALLRALAVEYPHQTTILRKPLSGVNVYNGGVAIVSRYPIGRTEQVVYPDCTGTDCFADKGFVYTEIIRAGKAYQVLATHAASFDSDAARQMRQAQFKLMQQFVSAKQFARTDMVLYGGDFNVNKLKFSDDYQAMQQNLRAKVPAISGYSASTFDPRVNYYAATYDTVEYLDYVLYSTDHRLPMASNNEVRVPRSVSNTLWKRWDLSDHFPVLGEFKD